MWMTGHVLSNGKYATSAIFEGGNTYHVVVVQVRGQTSCGEDLVR